MHLADNGLHLKVTGKWILANNFINGLNAVLRNLEGCNGC